MLTIVHHRLPTFLSACGNKEYSSRFQKNQSAPLSNECLSIFSS